MHTILHWQHQHNQEYAQYRPATTHYAHTNRTQILNAIIQTSSALNLNPSNKIKDMITPWMTKDIGYYELVLENFLSNATKIGQYENIKSDLLDMLIASNDITEDLKISINQTPATNTATEIVEYQTFYNLKLQTLVHNASKELITKFNYTF